MVQQHSAYLLGCLLCFLTDIFTLIYTALLYLAVQQHWLSRSITLIYTAVRALHLHRLQAAALHLYTLQAAALHLRRL